MASVVVEESTAGLVGRQNVEEWLGDISGGTEYVEDEAIESTAAPVTGCALLALVTNLLTIFRFVHR
jgi:hypothetical protein